MSRFVGMVGLVGMVGSERLITCCLLVLVGLSITGAVTPTAAQQPEPVLREIVIEGNTRTDRSVVERVIGLKPGDPLPMEAFDSAWDRLEDCGYFAYVDLDTDEDDDGNVILFVSVEEEKTTRFTPYLRYDRRHKYLLGAAMTDKNLGGRGEVLDLQAIAFYIQRARATWTKPWLFGADGLSVKVDAFWETAGFVYRGFDYDHTWATADFKQIIAGPLYVRAGGGYDTFNQHNDYDWDEGFDPTEGVTTYAASRRNTWVLRAGLGLDTRDNPFYPGSGFMADYLFANRTGLDIDNLSSHTVDLRAFIPMPGSPILALHAYGQKVDIPQYTEYVIRWGGPETVRGAPYAGREGNLAYIATAELRIPIFMMPVAVTGEQVGLGLHAFTDVGDAFYDNTDLADPKALFSFGAGAHINLLTWQLRFEAAKERDHGWTFEFMDVFNF